MILLYVFIERHATEDQKHEMIDRFLLCKDQNMVYWYAGVGVVVAALFFGQNRYWRKRNEILNEEVQRLSKWKSDHQQQQIASGMHHTEERTSGL